MVVDLYDSKISDTKRFIFSRQSMIATPYQKENAIKEMRYYLYPGVFLFVNNIIISKFMVS